LNKISARDLGSALAKMLGVPVEIVVVGTKKMTDACSSGAIEIGFMLADDERRTRVDFSPPYFVIESTYLVAGPSAIKTLADVDRPEVTVVGIAESRTAQQ
jgi:polar amino acid transport system substrate-binding protein